MQKPCYYTNGVVLGLFPFSKEMLKYISWGKRASL